MEAVYGRTDAARPRTLVIGLGNPSLTDDGVGVVVAQEVAARLGPHHETDVRELSVGGLRLAEAMFGYDRVIVVDAFVRADLDPGRIVRLRLEEVEAGATVHSHSPHDMTLSTGLRAGRLADYPVPSHVVFIGIGVENVSEFSEHLTERVRAAVPDAVDAVMRELAIGVEQVA